MTLCVMLPKVISPTELVSTSCSAMRVGTTMDNRLRTTIFDIHHSISYHIFEFHYKWVAKNVRWVTCFSIHCDRGKQLTKTKLSRLLVVLYLPPVDFIFSLNIEIYNCVALYTYHPTFIGPENRFRECFTLSFDLKDKKWRFRHDS